MRSYLSIWFSSDGTRPSEITQRLLSMGFRPMKGNYDYVYDWTESPNTEKAISLTEQVHATLKGCNVRFKMETL